MEEIKEKIEALKTKIANDEKNNDYINLTIYQNMLSEIEELIFKK